MNIILGILMDAFFITLLTWCSFTDIRTRAVPNTGVVLLLCLGIAHTMLMASTGNTWWTYPAGMALSVPFFIAWLKNGMGAGDVKLIIGIGLYLGLLNTILSFVLILPVMAVLCIHAWIRNRTLKQRIPFAPVMTLGAVGAVVLSYLIL